MKNSLRRAILLFSSAILVVSAQPALSAAAAGSPRESEISNSIARSMDTINSADTVVGVDSLTFGESYSATITSVQPGRVMPSAIATCSSVNGTCTILKTISATVEISANVGVGIGEINAALGTRYSSTVSLGINCTSPKLTSKQIFIARPQGTFYQFKLTERNLFGQVNWVKPVSLFVPTGISCIVKANP